MKYTNVYIWTAPRRYMENEKTYRCYCIEERLHAMGFMGESHTNLYCSICDGPEVAVNDR